MLYDRPVSDLMADARAELPERVRPADIVDWFARRYPKVKEATVRAHVIGLTVNDPSRRHYAWLARRQPLFFKSASGWIEPFDPDIHLSDDPTESEVDDDQDLGPDEAEGGDSDSAPSVEVPQEFYLEAYLEEFLLSNWAHLDWGRRLRIWDSGTGQRGHQLTTPIGRLDLLCEDLDSGALVVVELKRGRPSDRVVGQTARYMGWVAEHLAGPCRGGHHRRARRGRPAHIRGRTNTRSVLDGLRDQLHASGPDPRSLKTHDTRSHAGASHQDSDDSADSPIEPAFTSPGRQHARGQTFSLHVPHTSCTAGLVSLILNASGVQEVPMSEVVRDPSRGFECPRCGRPVTYKGRGRRPVWCSARCRVEASIERRGNRVVGVEPRVVMVVPPKQRVSEWEQNERRRIQETLTRDTLTAMVADDPFLLSRALEPAKVSARSRTEAERRALAQDLRRAAQDISPETPVLAGSDAWPPRGTGWKRGPMEWAVLLDELAEQLGNGQFYKRDLPLIDEPINRVAERYLRLRQG